MYVRKEQTVCEWAGVTPVPPKPNSKVGIALGSLGKGPINGLRHPEVGDTNGWYIWCGELSQAEDFFSPLHVEHLADYLPAVMEYLDLPPGYRFLIDGNDFEDVWFDEALIANPLHQVIQALREATREPAKLPEAIKAFQTMVWNSEEWESHYTSDAVEVLRDLAYDLDFYVPDAQMRAEDPSYYGIDRAIEEIIGALKRIGSL